MDISDTPLYIAAREGHKEVVEVLLSQGVDVNNATNHGWMPLHIAAREGHKEVVKVLLSHGADVNKANYIDRTALHIAAWGGHKDVVEVLLTHGADINKASNNGRTPLHLAAMDDHKEVVEVLLTHGADVNKAANNGRTPLHFACSIGASFEVVKLLLISWLSHEENRTNVGISSVSSLLENLEEEEEEEEGDVKVLLSHLNDLCSSNAYTRPPKDLMEYFFSIQLWNVTMLVLDRHPNAITKVIKTMDLDTKLMADFVSTVGRCCRLKTMWEVICNEQDLLGGVSHKKRKFEQHLLEGV